MNDEKLGGVFKAKKGFTVVQNPIARDKELSIKAKGLYLVIQSYITMPDKVWKKDDFIKFSTDGVKSFESAWKELKNKGYLRVHMYPSAGKWRIEYELLEEAQSGPHTIYYDKLGNPKSSNLTRSDNQNKSEKTNEEEEERTPLFGSNANGTYAEGGDIYNDNSQKLFVNHMCNNSFNHSVAARESNKKTYDGVTEQQPTVQLESDYPLTQGEIENIEMILQQNGGILPEEIDEYPEIAKKYIMVLAGWGWNCPENSNEEKLYRLVIECLVEMMLVKSIFICHTRAV